MPKKIAVFSRDTVAEDRNTIKKLLEMNLAIKINYNNFNVEKILHDLNNFEVHYNNRNFTNDYKKIADYIIQYNQLNYIYVKIELKEQHHWKNRVCEENSVNSFL